MSAAIALQILRCLAPPKIPSPSGEVRTTPVSAAVDPCEGMAKPAAGDTSDSQHGLLVTQPRAHPNPDLIEVIGEILAPTCRDVNGRSPCAHTSAALEHPSGRRPGTCPDCLGEGKANPGWPNPMTEVDCPTCQGSGETL